MWVSRSQPGGPCLLGGQPSQVGLDAGWGSGGFCLGLGLPTWAFRLLTFSPTSKLLGPGLGKEEECLVLASEPASVGLGGGLGPEGRPYGGGALRGCRG